MSKQKTYNIIFDPYRSRRIKHLLGDSIGITPIDIKKYLYIPKKLPSQSASYNKYNHPFNTSNIKNLTIETPTSVNSNIPPINPINTETLTSKEPETIPEVKRSNTEPTPQTNFEYHINTDQSSFIQLPDPDYGTNDKDLKTLIDLLNEKSTTENGYSHEIDEPDCQVYKKLEEGKDVVLIKNISNIPYNKDIILEAIFNPDIRKKWDKALEEMKIISNENDSDIIYMIINPPVFFITARDFVQRKKVWKNFPNDNSHLVHIVSVDNASYPPSKKYVRAKTIIMGYYIKDDPNKPGCSIIGGVSQTDLGGEIPISVINKFAAKGSKEWSDNLKKGCKIASGK